MYTAVSAYSHLCCACVCAAVCVGHSVCMFYVGKRECASEREQTEDVCNKRKWDGGGQASGDGTECVQPCLREVTGIAYAHMRICA